MTKIIISLIFVLTTITSFAQVKINESTPIDNTQKKQNIETVVFRLFPTHNMWTFLKLNTRNGKLWQVQFYVGENNRFETYLSLIPLVDAENEVNGRFTLYSTQNVNTFILLDQLDGRT